LYFLRIKAASYHKAKCGRPTTFLLAQRQAEDTERGNMADPNELFATDETEQVAAEELETAPEAELEAEVAETESEDTDYQALRDKLRSELLAELQSQLQEELRRNRQSLRDVGTSIVQRINERLNAAMMGVNQAVESGVMDADVAKQMRRDLRDKIELEEWQIAQREQAQQNALSAIEQQTNPNIKAQVEQQFAQIWQASGLQPNDPEVALLPTQLSGDPQNAVSQYRQAVQNALYAKQLRMKAASQQPKKTPPRVDMSSGQQVPRNTNPLAGIEDPDELWNLAKQQKKIY
jgi:hypothetical protein